MIAPATFPEILATGQIARLCHVAPRTAAKWIDQRRLRGYRIPGSADRRVRRVDLIRFLMEHGMLETTTVVTPTAEPLDRGPIAALLDRLRQLLDELDQLLRRTSEATS